ncbi:hypothetical protein FWP36_22320 [Vibrio parahaemolyticus]|nr:hypothetical protein [Vibrio parahaemolyticus]EGQ9712259.1 hypothetical protein [Vibrio parahaemolyticus]EGQ9799060.1 hypothetical protein [Vibrio parahaemolyticus]
MKRLPFRAKFQPIHPLRRQTNLKRFEPKKLATNRPKKRMRQPEKLDMFYGLSDSRTWGDKTRLPKD